LIIQLAPQESSSIRDCVLMRLSSYFYISSSAFGSASFIFLFVSYTPQTEDFSFRFFVLHSIRVDWSLHQLAMHENHYVVPAVGME
jgi:hypothetical protein